MKLQTSDKEIFNVDIEVAKCLGLIKTMLEDLGIEEDDDEPVSLSNVTSTIFKKVIEWATHHKDDPPFDEERATKIDSISSWDSEFFKVDQNTLFELITAANYLDVKGLLYMGCKVVADIMRGMTTQELIKTFKIENDTATEP